MNRLSVLLCVVCLFSGVGIGVFIQFNHDADVLAEARDKQTAAERNAENLQSVVNSKGTLKAIARQIKLPDQREAVPVH